MLLAQLQALGVRRGDVLLVHSALSKVGASAQNLIEALLTAIGPAGTLVMPSMADDDDVPFDRAHSSCRAVGLVADTFCACRASCAATARTPLPRTARSPRASPRRIQSMSRTASTARRDGFIN